MSDNDLDVNDDVQHAAKLHSLARRVLEQAVADAAAGDRESLAWLREGGPDLTTWARHAGIRVPLIRDAAEDVGSLAATWKRLRAEADGVPTLKRQRPPR